MNQASTAVVGAGPAGLMLARVLQQRGIAVTVFEAEPSGDHRGQGGTLDMHPESGQRALHMAGLAESFKAIARYEDQGSRLCDTRATLLYSDESVDGDRPEADRRMLRDLLLNSLTDGTVRWGAKLTEVRRVGAAFDLYFADAPVERFDRVVGADGAWSRVRALLTQDKPLYTGVTFVELGIDDIDRAHPVLANLVGRGKIFALGDSKGLIAQRNAHGHIRIYAGLRVPSDWATQRDLELGDTESLRQALLTEFAGWSPVLLDLLRAPAQVMAIRPIHSFPAEHRWPHQKGVTVIGDAAHVMSPFGGDGANLAMLDAAELGLALTAQADDTAAVARFEEKMWARASEAIRGAWEGINEAFAPGALESMLAHLQTQHV